MGVLHRFERALERAVKAPFAKVFKAEVQPVEIASAMRGAMDERAAVLGPGRTMVPNVFTIELASTDYERLASYDTALLDELVAAAEDHAEAQRYTAGGPMEVRLTSHDELETGIFRVRPASRNRRREGRPASPPDPGARPQRPQDQRQRDDRLPQEHGARGQAPQGSPQQQPPQQQPPQQQPPQQRGRPVQPALGYDPEEFRPQGALPSGGQAPAGQAQAGMAAGMGAGMAGGATAVAPQGGPAPYQQHATPPHQQHAAPPYQHAESRTREFPPASEAPPAQAVRGPQPWIEIDGRGQALTAAVTTLGRDASADIVLDDPGVSRRHAELRISHDGPHLQVFVRDLGSTNGTYLNGDQVGNEQLVEGDRLTMGHTAIIFHLDGGR